MQANRDGHLDRAATGHKRGVENDVARDGHGVCQVAVDLVQDVLGWPTEEDGACFRGRAFGQESEVSVGGKGRVMVGDICKEKKKRILLVADLFNVE